MKSTTGIAAGSRQNISSPSLFSAAVATVAGAVVLSMLVRRARRASARRRQVWQGKTVVIMGGSRGLGLELARCWIEQGAKVALCARTEKDVDWAVRDLRNRGDEAIGEPCDVTSLTEVKRFINSVIEKFGKIDVLVNNAGIIQTGPVSCMTLDDYRAAMDTHYWGPLYAIEAALPHLRREGLGRIVNITSIGGKIPVPHLVPYCASKFALVGLSEGLRTELLSEGITVTTVVPGLMRTGSPRNALFKGRHRAEYAWFSISDSLPIVSISSREAAEQIIFACRMGRAHLAFIPAAKIAIRLHGLLPGISATVLALVNRLLPKPGGIGTRAAAGKDSFSAWSPSVLTALTERAAARNNELR